MFESDNLEEAKKMFKKFASILKPLLDKAGEKLSTHFSVLEKCVKNVMKHPEWTCAHVAYEVKLFECFKTAEVAQ